MSTKIRRFFFKVKGIQDLALKIGLKNRILIINKMCGINSGKAEGGGTVVHQVGGRRGLNSERKLH